MSRIPDFFLTILALQLAAVPAWAAPKEKQTQNPAIVYIVAGQSNVGGCGVYSPEMHKALGRDKKRPLNSGTTTAEAGLSTRAEDYTHSYIWIPDKNFERMDPMVTNRPIEPGMKRHGAAGRALARSAVSRQRHQCD